MDPIEMVAGAALVWAITLFGSGDDHVTCAYQRDHDGGP
jgi:hypothetical protein